MQAQGSSTESAVKDSGTSPKDKLKTKLKPLKITCTSSDCNSGLHCFKATKKMVKANLEGRCRSCGISLVNWERVHNRNLNDAAYTFQALKYELIRHHFWHIEIDPKAINHARRKGKIGMRAAAENRIKKSVGDAHPVFDGRQTPKSGNALFYAQHATASCCRKCIEEWHGIEMGRELSPAEIAYLTELLVLFIDERLPDLTEEGEKVPAITSRKQHVDEPLSAGMAAKKEDVNAQE